MPVSSASLVGGAEPRREPSTPAELAREIFAGAVAAASPGAATERAIDALQLPRGKQVMVYAIGKAAGEMAASAVRALQRGLQHVQGGLIVAPEHVAAPWGTMIAVRGDHPVPGPRSFDAANRLGDLTRGRMTGDAALVLVSGGASSLIGAPARGIGESDLVHVYEVLLGAGLDVAMMNAVRKRFARWGGGRLALALAPAATHCLVVSDVIGDDPSDVGSGPCVPDRYTIRDVYPILEKAKLLQRLTPTAREYLQAMARGVIPDTPKRTHPAFAHVTARVIAGNRHALAGAAERARALGVDRVEVAAAAIDGDAATRGAELARQLIALQAQRDTNAPKYALVWGGETTVTLGTGAVGRGGRSQELALAAARALAEGGSSAQGITLLAAGTDGRDGPTDAAGACVDATTWQAIAAAGRDPAHALAQHDAYPALEAAGALVKTGPTGTNVADVVIGLVS